MIIKYVRKEPDRSTQKAKSHYYPVHANKSGLTSQLCYCRDAVIGKSASEQINLFRLIGSSITDVGFPGKRIVYVMADAANLHHFKWQMKEITVGKAVSRTLLSMHLFTHKPLFHRKPGLNSSVRKLSYYASIFENVIKLLIYIQNSSIL